jgi:hypothetical protein
MRVWALGGGWECLATVRAHTRWVHSLAGAGSLLFSSESSYSRSLLALPSRASGSATISDTTAPKFVAHPGGDHYFCLFLPSMCPHSSFDSLPT